MNRFFKIPFFWLLLFLIAIQTFFPKVALAREFYNDTSCTLFVEFFNPDDEVDVFPCHTAKLAAGKSTDTSKTFFGGCLKYNKIDLRVTSEIGITRIKYNNVANDRQIKEPFNLTKIPIVKQLKNSNCRTW